MENGGRREEEQRTCPYLGTIRRELLDFDLQKQCSKTLMTHNVYACLVCGMYLHGRGEGTPAHQHSLQARHYLFLHLHQGAVFCLPDSYEVRDPTLADILFNLSPHFTPAEIRELDRTQTVARAVDGVRFIPGTVGLNNLKATDYINVVLQVLFSVTEVRDELMLARPLEAAGMTKAIGELYRRMTNPKGFRSHIAPYEVVKLIEKLSNSFKLTQQGDPQALWTWLVNTLISEQRISKTVKKAFKGKLQKVGTESQSSLPFLTAQESPIPTVEFAQLLDAFAQKYRLKCTGRYLVFYFKRFSQNRFFREKNSTIVNFPVRGLSLAPLFQDPQSAQLFDLAACISHAGEVNTGSYKCYVHRPASDKFYEIHDLLVSEVLPQVIPLSEACVLVFRGRR